MGLKHRIALIFINSGFFFALLALYSNALGMDWVCKDLGAQKTLYSVCYGSGTFVAVGQGGTVLSSADAENWTDFTKENASQTTGADLYCVCYGRGSFVAAGSYGKIITSTDGMKWTASEVGLPATISILAVCYGKDTFLAFTSDKSCLISSDGVLWSAVHNPPQYNIFSACHYERGFAAVGEINWDYGTLYCAVSDDGKSWTEQFTGVKSSSCFLNSICRGDRNFIAVGSGGYILAAEDGADWSAVECPEDGIFYHDYYGVCCDGAGTIVLVGKSISTNTGLLRISTDDGRSWSKIKALDCVPRSVCYGGGTFVAVGDEGKIVYSAPQYSVTIGTYINGLQKAAPGVVELRQGGITRSTALSTSTGVYTANVASGEYDVFINNEDTKSNVTVKDAEASSNVSYYTVSFCISSEGSEFEGKITATVNGQAITSGTPVLSGKKIEISAKAKSCNYLWTGDGTSGQTSNEIIIPELCGKVDAVCALSLNPLYVPLSFVGSESLTIAQNASAAEIRQLLRVNGGDEGQTLTWTLATAPKSGILVFSSETAALDADGLMVGSITYQPKTGYAGKDSFKIQASNGEESAERTIEVSVIPLAPGVPVLSELSDTGISSTDNITCAESLNFSGRSAPGDEKSTVWVFLDSNHSGSFDSGAEPSASAVVKNGLWTVTGLDTRGLSQDVYNVYAFTVSADGSLKSLSSAPVEVVLNITAPTVTDMSISISGATGKDGKFLIEDTVKATWNNTTMFDGNIDVSCVAVDFTEFGGGIIDAAEESPFIWTASYKITKDSKNGSGFNVSIIVTDIAGNSSSAEDTSNAFVETFLNTGGGQSGGGQSDGGQTGGVVPSSPAQNKDKIEISTNGKGQSIATVTVDENKLDTILGSEQNGTTVKIDVKGSFEVSEVVLSGEIISKMENKDAMLVVQTDLAVYSLPASIIDIRGISERFGAEVLPADIKVTVQIARPSNEKVAAFESAARANGCSIVVPAVNFTVSCALNGESIEISTFSNYIERMIAIPDGVNPEKITTGVVLDEDGSIRQVPTRVASINGKYYAIIKSLTNSTYAAISYQNEFSDVKTHWAKDFIGDLSSRLVIKGTGDNQFDPDSKATRAEFAALLVRALGLAPQTGENKFSDVDVEDWFCSYINTAARYEIVYGYDEKSFGPNDLITREQAMSMTARAMKIVSLNLCLKDSEAESLLEVYKDGQELSKYARQGAASCIKEEVLPVPSGFILLPKEYLTRAEVAVMVWRMLNNSKLI